jgi:hypothetical protein
LARERLALGLEIHSSCQALELAATGLGAAKLGHQ